MTDPLAPYQEEAKARLLTHRRFLLADAPGVGKTWPLLAAAAELGRPTLFVVPAHLTYQWREVARERHPEIRCEAHLPGVAPKRADALAGDPGVRWLVTSYHRLRDLKRLCSTRWECVVLDEAHQLRNHRAAWTEAALTLGDQSSRVMWLATGTPEVSDGGDWYVYARLLNLLDHRSYWKFVGRHCNSQWLPFGREIGGLKRPAAELLGHKWLRRELAAVAPGLTEPVKHHVRLVLPGALLARYRRIKKSYRTEEGEPIDGAGQMAHYLRRWVSLHAEPKIKELGRIVGEAHAREPVVVLTWYRDTRDSVARLFSPYRVAVLRAEDPAAHQRGVIEEWARVPNGVLVATLPHVKEGLDGLQHHARVLVLYEPSHLAAENEQAIARVWRRGQAEQVHVYGAQVDQTIDAAVWRAAGDRKARALEGLLQEDDQ